MAGFVAMASLEAGISRGGEADVDSVFRADMSLPSIEPSRQSTKSNTEDDGVRQRRRDTYPSVDTSSQLSRTPSVSAAEGPFEAGCCDSFVLG